MRPFRSLAVRRAVCAAALETVGMARRGGGFAKQWSSKRIGHSLVLGLGVLSTRGLL